jgi:hypothetical protein
MYLNKDNHAHGVINVLSIMRTAILGTVSGGSRLKTRKRPDQRALTDLSKADTVVLRFTTRRRDLLSASASRSRNQPRD